LSVHPFICIHLRYKEMKSQFDAKMNTDKRMHTQSTTEIETSLTEDRTLLDKEEEEPTEVTNPTLDEKTNTDKKIPNTDTDEEIPNTDEEKPP